VKEGREGRREGRQVRTTADGLFPFAGHFGPAFAALTKGLALLVVNVYISLCVRLRRNEKMCLAFSFSSLPPSLPPSILSALPSPPPSTPCIPPSQSPCTHPLHKSAYQPSLPPSLPPSLTISSAEQAMHSPVTKQVYPSSIKSAWLLDRWYKNKLGLLSSCCCFWRCCCCCFSFSASSFLPSRPASSLRSSSSLVMVMPSLFPSRVGRRKRTRKRSRRRRREGGRKGVGRGARLRFRIIWGIAACLGEGKEGGRGR